MTCEHCGAALHPVAQFCGRCGRSVGVVAPAPAPVGGSIVAPEPEPEPCVVCGTVPQPTDRFCGECGTGVGAKQGALFAAHPGDQPESQLASASEPEPEPEPESEPETVPEPQPAAQPAVASEPEVRPTAERFVLQFSTGESVSVIGSGILGRNPRPEPGEAIDHIVIVTDPTRSVSKTHLEFGHENGVFWVSDRHSGNGTVLRESGQLPKYCEPGRRYHIARGTRVDMGDQFMILA
jgi:hypothetical protein